MIAISLSRPVVGFKMQLAPCPFVTLPIHPTLQPTQGMMSSNCPAAALFGSSGSAFSARPIDTMSARPVSRTNSAICGVLILPTQITGTSTTCLIASAKGALSASGVPPGATTAQKTVGIVPPDTSRASTPASTRMRAMNWVS